MGHRNNLCPNQVIDLNVDLHVHGQGYLHPEPCFPFGGSSNIIQPTLHPTTGAASVNPTHFEGQHFPEQHDGGLFFGRTQHERAQHHHHPVESTSNFFAPYMTQGPGNGILPIGLNYCPTDHLASANDYRNVGISPDEYGRHGHLMDGSDRGSYKRKYAEGYPGNFQYANGGAGSSSSAANPLETRHPDRASYPTPQYGGNASSSSSVREVGPSGSLATESVNMAHSYNQMLQNQPFAPSGVAWFHQQASNNGRDGATSAWTHHVPTPSYSNGNNIIGGASGENADMAIPWYHEIANNRSSGSFIPPSPPPINILCPNLFPPVAPPVFLPPPAVAPNRIPPNYVSQDGNGGMHVSHRQLISFPPPPGLRVYRSHRVGGLPEATLRHRSIPHLRMLPSEQVAMLESYYEMENSLDHHRDMRLDIEHMSYEELLALEEEIGSVSTGLSEETISSRLETRTYFPSATGFNLEEVACPDQDSDSCIICQEEYKNREKIGVLKCGHEYHAICVRQWLVVKNTCPICKSEALDA
ncbi:probable E3 ubiquitin-protein ligase ZFP1 [Rutidosis leptorrhynchoides]|uniref:probable E3 ubiquitin-protein ligase ZFP1 n=1 Tax=Rutidosis leptorrhynchoides TaxID=125765 RepID=UPI003A991349